MSAAAPVQFAGATHAAWLASSMILLDRQLGVSRNVDGSIDVRMGDGIHTFFNLPAVTDVALIAAVRSDIAQSLTSGQQTQAAANIALGIPATISAAAERTLYVTPRGNDSSDGLTLKTAKLTLAAAVATMNDGNGGTIQLGYGSITSAAVTLPTGVRLRGCGQLATTLRINGVASAALTLGIDCAVSDLWVRGDATASSIGLAATSGSYHWSVHQAKVSGFATAVKLDNTWASAFHDVILQSGAYGLVVTGSQVNAIYVYGGEIQGFTSAGVYNDNTGGTSKVAFFGTTIEGCSGYGVHLNSGVTYDWSFHACYFEANTLGHIYSPGQTRALGIEGCVFLGAAAFSISLTLGIDVRINGNFFNLTSANPSITLGGSVVRPYIGKNWYATGQESVTSGFPTGSIVIDREIQLPASATTGASIRLPHGTAPTSPVNGDLWTTTAGVYARVNGATVGPLAATTAAIGQLEFMSTMGNHPATPEWAISSKTLAVASQAILTRFVPYRNMTVSQLRWVTGSATSGNYDIGIYSSTGTLLWAKGSTAWPAINTVTVETVSPTVAMTAGTEYLIAFAGDNTTGTFLGAAEPIVGTVVMLDGSAFFGRSVATSFPLPSPITPGTTRIGRQPYVALHGA